METEPGFKALDTFNRLEGLVVKVNAEAPLTMKSSPAFQTSDLWVKMFTEVRPSVAVLPPPCTGAFPYNP